MEIWATVYTTGERVSFSFSAGSEFDYISIEDIDAKYVKEEISATLGESFYEALNGDDPDEIIFNLLKQDDRYRGALLMEKEKQEEFIWAYVSEILNTTKTSYEADGIDISNIMGNEEGEWDDYIFESIGTWVYILLRSESERGTD